MLSKERKKFLDVLGRNLLVCSKKTLEAVINSLSEEEKKELLKILKKLKVTS